MLFPFGLLRPRTVSHFIQVCLALGALIAVAAAQQPHQRISGDVASSARTTISGTRPERALPANDVGAVAGNTRLQGMTLVFAMSDTQEAALQTLLAAQQNPSSSLYHQWLTPAQYAASFGMADVDLSEAETWLQEQGFSVDSVSRSHDRITFSGNAAQVAAAFGAQIHRFTAGGQMHFAPASDISLPSALAAVVRTVGNLSDFRPRPHVTIKAPVAVKPNFTSSQTQSHFLTPEDVATTYDINAAYSAGYTGSGQSIAVVGQSAVVTTDITNFQTAAGLTAKAPTLVLVPNTGTSVTSSGDEVESDLDLEYTGGIAKGATIYFVYTGSNTNYGVFDALEYAVDNDTAPIISISYGDCETDLGSTYYSSLNAILEEAASQGQSVIASAGDDGSTDCYEDTDLSTTARKALAVDFPADSQYVTGMGGTEFTSAAVASTNTTYWTAASGSDVISTALSYMPEQVWNDDSSSEGLSSGGGGISIYTARPSWQTGVTGIASGGYRLVPDLSLSSSPNNAGYLYCSSDSTSTGITGSCSHGFRDSSDVYLTVAGGTSFAAPVFAGMLAIINQAKNYMTGQGVINPTLYSLASNSTTYASAFHDITSGSNACAAGSTYCSTPGESEWSATTGYDEASGLGSVDLYNLLTAWPSGSSTTSTLAASATTLSAVTTTPASGASDAITITVASGSSSVTATPTGTVSLEVDGTTVDSALALTSGKATYTFSSTTIGAHSVSATYSGDTNYAASNGSLTLTVPTTGSFSLAAENVSVTAGGSATSTLTVTPASGYTGTIAFTASSASLTNACYVISNATVSGTNAVAAAFTVYTDESACATADASGTTSLRKFSGTASAGIRIPASPDHRGIPLAIGFATLLFAGCFQRRGRKIRALCAGALLAVAGFGISGCGESAGSTTTTSTNSTAGAYTITVTGTDTASSTLKVSTTFTLTVN